MSRIRRDAEVPSRQVQPPQDAAFRRHAPNGARPGQGSSTHREEKDTRTTIASTAVALSAAALTVGLAGTGVLRPVRDR